MAEPIRSYRRLGARTLAIFIIAKLKGFVVFCLLAGGIIGGVAWGKEAIPPEYEKYKMYADVVLSSPVISIAFLIGVAMIGLAILSGWLEYIHYTLAISNNGLIVKKGVMTQRERSIPYRRIQEVKLHRTLFDMMWGVSTVLIDIIGESDGELMEDDRMTLPAVGKAMAEEIRDELVRRAQIEQITVHSNGPTNHQAV